MALPFDSNEFKAAVANCKKQFSPVALADYIGDMIEDYELLLKKHKKPRPVPPPPKPDPHTLTMGEILMKHQNLISLDELPVSIIDGNKKHPARENVSIYFNEIARLEKN